MIAARVSRHQLPAARDEAVQCCVCTSVTNFAEAEDIGKSYGSRILRLTLLVPDIVETILAGRADQALMLERLERLRCGDQV